MTGALEDAPPASHTQMLVRYSEQHGKGGLLRATHYQPYFTGKLKDTKLSGLFSEKYKTSFPVKAHLVGL